MFVDLLVKFEDIEVNISISGQCIGLITDLSFFSRLVNTMGKGFFSHEFETKSSDEFQGTRNHIFDDSDAAEYWANVYEKAQYEGRHRFDPSFTWTPEEEKKLVRKVGLLLPLFSY